jgi:carbamoyltransferase
MRDFCLGISMGQSAGGVVLLQDGQVVSSRMDKFTYRRRAALPSKAIESLLSDAGITNFDEIRTVALSSPQDGHAEDRGWLENLINLPAEMRREKRMRAKIQAELERIGGCQVENLVSVPGELALAEGLRRLAGDELTAILILDSPFEQMGSGLWLVREGEMKTLWRNSFPLTFSHFLHNLATFSGFRGRLGQKQFLALAEYGEPRFEDLLKENLFWWDEGGKLEFNVDLLSMDPARASQWTALEHLFNGETRMPDHPISSREIDLAHAIVGRAKTWASEQGKCLVKTEGCKRLIVRGHGPLFDAMASSWNTNETGLTKITFVHRNDEPKLAATGAAALSQS